MSELHLFLYLPDQVCQFFTLPASSVIETTLTISPNHTSLPTLVSVENIIGKINAKGFDLANSNEVHKIASLVNNYLVTEESDWKNRSIDLKVTQISAQDRKLYDEIQNLRSITTNMVHDITYFNKQNDYHSAKKVQDAALQQVTQAVKSQKTWWDTHKGKIFELFGKTAITTIWGKLIGIALDNFIKTIL